MEARRTLLSNNDRLLHEMSYLLFDASKGNKEDNDSTALIKIDA
jgi:hypothetical protein